MHRFARIVLGYHGCSTAFAEELFSGTKTVAEWQPSENTHDWLGKGIYFWEHSPERAEQWARARHGDRGAVIDAVLQLGDCFDLTDVAKSRELRETHVERMPPPPGHWTELLFERSAPPASDAAEKPAAAPVEL